MKKQVAASAFCLLLAVSILPGCSTQSNGQGSVSAGQAQSQEASFASWNAEADALKQLQDYVTAATDESSEDFVPVEDRIAVFDFDGTLFGEKDPVYYEWLIYAYRVLEDPDYKDKATKGQIDIANSILEAGKTGIMPEDLENVQAGYQAQVFEGMTAEEFVAYVRAYMENTESPSFEGLKRADEFYLPMKEVVGYLQSNDFQIYLCSGTDRFSVRAMACDNLGIPEQNVIGTDVRYKPEGLTDDDGEEYQLSDGEDMIRTDVVTNKNIKSNKVRSLENQLGKKPVLSFGNSGGDESMASFVTADNPYKSKAFMVLCDDVERENGNLEKAAAQKKQWEAKGWTTISMAKDWVTIYGPDATLKK